MAIDPGSREMGIVILEDSDLKFYQVKSLKDFRPEKPLKKAVSDILSRIIDDYDVSTIVVEKGWFSQERAPLFQLVFRTIEEVARRKKLQYFAYAPKTIRQRVCGDGKATKQRTARLLADRYPELEIYLTQDYRYKEKYWLNVFDALAAGLTHLEQE